MPQYSLPTDSAQSVSNAQDMTLPLIVVYLLVAVSCAAPAGQQWRDPSPHQVRFITVDSSVKLEVLDWGGSGVPIVLLGCYLIGHPGRQLVWRLDADPAGRAAP